MAELRRMRARTRGQEPEKVDGSNPSEATINYMSNQKQKTMKKTYDILNQNIMKTLINPESVVNNRLVWKKTAEVLIPQDNTKSLVVYKAVNKITGEEASVVTGECWEGYPGAPGIVPYPTRDWYLY